MWQIIIKWLVGIVVTAIIGSIMAWLAGFLNSYLWPPARVRLALKNFKNYRSDVRTHNAQKTVFASSCVG